jgi:DNA-binding transcriptional LysR family regulator
LRDADEEAGTAQTLPVGRLKIHAMAAIGNHYVINAIARYREIHPTVMFDLTLSNRLPDLLEESYDMSIVLARDLPDSGFVAQRLAPLTAFSVHRRHTWPNAATPLHLPTSPRTIACASSTR